MGAAGGGVGVWGGGLERMYSLHGDQQKMKTGERAGPGPAAEVYIHRP